MDFDDFDRNLTKETDILHNWFDTQRFKSDGLTAGAEIEFLILDKNYHLIPANLEFVEQVAETGLIPEAGASQLEMNTQPVRIDSDFLSRMHQNILTLWNKCCVMARQHDHHIALIGAMPQAEKQHLEPGYITPESYFYLMDDYAKQYRYGKPLAIRLEGEKDSLSLNPSSLAMEGLISSFQLHLQVNESESVAYYNIIQMISAYMVALCSNAPYFYGKNLWSESRIPVFEQLYTFPTPMAKSVFFEPDYADQSLFSLFEDNKERYLRLLPEVVAYEKDTRMFHVQRQNSCVYRWNRPIVDFNQQGEPTLRIEHRVLSTGPTVVDMVANAAFFYGMVYYFVNQSISAQTLVSCKEARTNFYEAAYFGLDAKLMWRSSKQPVAKVLADMLPCAAKGLSQLGVDQKDILYYLQIIQRRITQRQNGSLWQQRFMQNNPGDFDGMLGAYLQNQYSETPVADWS